MICVCFCDFHFSLHPFFPLLLIFNKIHVPIVISQSDFHFVNEWGILSSLFFWLISVCFAAIVVVHLCDHDFYSTKKKTRNWFYLRRSNQSFQIEWIKSNQIEHICTHRFYLIGIYHNNFLLNLRWRFIWHLQDVHERRNVCINVFIYFLKKNQIFLF